MSRRTRRLRRLAIGVIAASLAVPAGAQATTDARGEFSKSPDTGAQLVRGTDARGEFSKSPETGAQLVRGTDARGEFSKAAAGASEFPWSDNYRGGESKADFPGTEPAPVAAPSNAIEPTDGGDALPYIVSGLALLVGLALVAIVVPMTRRVRVDG